MTDEDQTLFNLLMNKKKEIKEEEQQSSELKGLLEDLDIHKIPKLKSAVSTSTVSPSENSTGNIAPTTEATASEQIAEPPTQITKPPTPTPAKFPNTKLTAPPKAPKSVKLSTKPPEIPKPTPTDETKGIDKILNAKSTGDFFKDMEIFFKQLERAYAIRYDLWDNTTLTVLNILRRMNENIEQNTEVMIDTIQELHKKITKGLKDFEIKRNEIERFSDVDFKLVSKTFKKTLELLNFQVREFKLQESINGLYNIYLN